MIAWTLARFDALSGHDVHDLLALRCQVFVLEQHCPYRDIDGLDPLPGTRHLLARLGRGSAAPGRLIACARSLGPVGVSATRPAHGQAHGATHEHVAAGACTDARIGRVVVAASHRRQGLARQLLQRLTRDLDTRLPGVSQRLDAQIAAVPLYENAGFVISGEPFLEDGIEHVTMRRGFAREVG